jgi:hypothetical protein
MSRYDKIKTLKPAKARRRWTCHACGAAIERGEFYFRESLGLIAKPPGVELLSFWLACGKARGREPEVRGE